MEETIIKWSSKKIVLSLILYLPRKAGVGKY